MKIKTYFMEHCRCWRQSLVRRGVFSCFQLMIALGVFFAGISGAHAKEPRPWQMGFQDAATPIMERVNDLHTILLWVIFPIGVLVTGLLLYVVWRFRASANPTPSKRTHHISLEVVWTLIPALIVLGLSIPSIKLIYYADEIHDSQLTVKIVGHQWYWHYDYPDHGIGFDSLMIASKELKPGDRRLLEVDNQMVVPVNTNIRLILTSQDVLHSWTIPSFGVKQDTVPGKLKEIWINVTKEGTYYGQCSEICGTGHAFMPIAVRVVSKEAFDGWLGDAKTKFASAPSPLLLASR